MVGHPGRGVERPTAGILGQQGIDFVAQRRVIPAGSRQIELALGDVELDGFVIDRCNPLPLVRGHREMPGDVERPKR
ncbi:MAG: hypothetical protein ABIT71_20680 [Vicinamibacteraceae bacterium]